MASTRLLFSGKLNKDMSLIFAVQLCVTDVCSDGRITVISSS